MGIKIELDYGMSEEVRGGLQKQRAFNMRVARIMNEPKGKYIKVVARCVEDAKSCTRLYLEIGRKRRIQ